MSGWRPDVLGPGFEALTLPLADDDEGTVVATLVRYRPDPDGDPGYRPAKAVLYVHGWSDYFFQRELAEHWHGLGAAFYALDLRAYGRSLLPHQTPGFVDDLEVYDEEIDAAVAVIREQLGRWGRLLLMGHSAGGLVLSLWADRHPGAASGLVLNSPWLELQGSTVLRTLGIPVLDQLARLDPRAAVPFHDPGLYARTTSAELEGEWSYDMRWKPPRMFPVRAGWLAAFLRGHERVAQGLAVDCPVLVLLSARSLVSPRWHEEMRSADVVLDVELLARRAVQVGPHVTVVRIAGGLHDLALSAPGVRERFYAAMERWSVPYAWG